MNFKLIPPIKEVSHLVESLWINTLYDEDLQTEYDYIIPDGVSDIIFMLNGSYNRVDLTGDITYTVQHCSYVPAFTKAVKVTQEPLTSCLGIRLRPGALKFLTGFDAADLQNPVYALSDLLPDFSESIMESIESGKEQNDIVNYIYTFLQSFEGSENKVNYVDDFIKTVNSFSGIVSIKNFCDNYGVHKSTLEKRFKEYVGISPKSYCKIIRFKNALHQIHSSNSPLTQIGYDSGYFDQSHMIKDFKNILGITPTEYLSKNFILPRLHTDKFKAINGF